MINFPFGTNGKLIILGVPILKHITVIISILHLKIQIISSLLLIIFLLLFLITNAHLSSLLSFLLYFFSKRRHLIYNLIPVNFLNENNPFKK